MKITLITFTLLSIAAIVNADTLIDGIYYNISVTTTAVSIDDNNYTCSISIPSSVIYDNISYKATGITANLITKCI